MRKKHMKIYMAKIFELIAPKRNDNDKSLHAMFDDTLCAIHNFKLFNHLSEGILAAWDEPRFRAILNFLLEGTPQPYIVW